MANDLAKAAKDRKIKYFLISFVDLLGVLRAKLVPASAIAEMQENGAGFAGFATWLDMTPAHPDMFAKPDPASLIQLPWQPDVGWLAADLWMDGKEVEASPRAALKRQIEAAAKDGWRMKTGVECEYFLLAADGRALADARDTQEKPCYDQSALMRRYPVITEICDAMLALGWGAYQNDHEDANGQFEMNWAYDDALVTADRHVFFKYMVKTLAEKHGLRATFMPKPFRHLTGNGCHAHVSIWDEAGKRNLFLEPQGPGRPVAAGLSLPRRDHAWRRRAVRGLQSDREQLQADQRAAHAVRCHLGAQRGQLQRQQPHPHDPDSRRRPARAAPARRLGQSLSRPGGDPDARQRRHARPSAIPARGSTATCTRRAICTRS